MSGQSIHVGSKRPREVFLTSSSLSFSSLSSSCISSEDAIEMIITKTPRTSYEDQIRGSKVLKAYSPLDSETSCVTSHVRIEHAPMMNRCLGTHYDPERIPASVFAKSTVGDLNWSEVSNDSLFSLRMSTSQGFRMSNITPEDGEFLAYSPSLLGMPEEAEEEKRSSQVAKCVVMTSVKANTHREKSTPQVVTCSFDQLYQAPLRKPKAFPIPLGEKKSKKRKKTRRSKKMNKKKQDMWSWLCSGVSKCNFHCCCCCRSRGPDAILL